MDEAEGMGETGGMGDDGKTRGEVGTWEGRLCEEIEREGVDVQVVQKLPSEVATADEEGVFTWAPASGSERVEVGVI